MRQKRNLALALTKTISIGIIALLVVVLGQFLLALFGIYTPSWLEIGISGIGVLLFAGAAVVDFYILPRTYRNDQYLPAALSMYLTYINLFVFILRLLIAIKINNSESSREDHDRTPRHQTRSRNVISAPG
jgi:uncharacterized protein